MVDVLEPKMRWLKQKQDRLADGEDFIIDGRKWYALEGVTVAAGSNVA